MAHLNPSSVQQHVQNPTNPTNPTRTKKGPVVCSAAVIPTNLQNPTNPTNPTQKKICRIVHQLASPPARGPAADPGLPGWLVSAPLAAKIVPDGFRGPTATAMQVRPP